MSRRIICDDDDDVDVITRSSSRLRALHYYDQRASADVLPLISASQRAARDSYLSPPPPPPPIYQPQPHQLIAVCFNHMSGRQCDHCQRMNDHNERHERMEGSPDSGKTLDRRQQRQSNGSDLDGDEILRDGGEKGKAKVFPAPVGIWDKRLNKVRLQVFGLWARTSQLVNVFVVGSQLLIIVQL